MPLGSVKNNGIYYMKDTNTRDTITVNTIHALDRMYCRTLFGWWERVVTNPFDLVGEILCKTGTKQIVAIYIF